MIRGASAISWTTRSTRAWNPTGSSGATGREAPWARRGCASEVPWRQPGSGRGQIDPDVPDFPGGPERHLDQVGNAGGRQDQAGAAGGGAVVRPAGIAEVFGLRR